MAEFALSPNRLWSAFRSQRLPLQALWAGAVLIAAVLLANLAMSLKQPVYAPLYGHLSDRDGGAILQALDKLNVPYKVAGGIIQIPAPEVEATRYRLAAQGLPKAENGGFDAMATPTLGMTSFQEQIGYQHALEGELSRTLENLAPVASARVHLAIPKASAFLRDGPQPSAAVLIKTKVGMRLDDEQVQSIRQIVANGVPRMSVAQVGIVNEQGELLARAEESERQALSPDEREAVHTTEAELADRVTEALAPWLGKGNIRVQVTARLNFTEKQTTYERARSYSRGMNRTVQTTREPSGQIERLSALVVVNETSLPESERRDPATQKKIQHLVSQALGMESRRRDSLQVVLLPFELAPMKIPEVPVPLVEKVSERATSAPFLTLAAITLAGLVLLAIVFLRVMKGRRNSNAIAEEPKQTRSPFDEAVDAARTLVLDDPARAASVIHLWVQS
ncbi:MAG: flagellar basal-body MS-ring/collar protein FliF [Thiobacillaceae bacterium]